MRPRKYYFKRHFGASKTALAKARVLKLDFPVHGDRSFVGFSCICHFIGFAGDVRWVGGQSKTRKSSLGSKEELKMVAAVRTSY